MKNTLVTLTFIVSTAPAAELQPLLAQPGHIVISIPKFEPVNIKQKAR